MPIFDPHVHMYSRTTDDYDRMSLAGIRIIVEPAFWLGSQRSSVSTYTDYFNHILEFESARASKYGIEHYCCIAMNPKEANNLDVAVQVIDSLPQFLNHPRCLALGEVGFDQQTDAEEFVMRRQLQLAKERELLVMIHTPHTQKKTGTERTIRILLEEGMDPQKILIDHNTEETIEAALDYGAWAGMTIYPGKMSPERAVHVLKKYGTSRMMINSAADWGPSDPLGVPRTSRLMRESDFSDSEIERVVWENPYNFYAQSGKIVLHQ